MESSTNDKKTQGIFSDEEKSSRQATESLAALIRNTVRELGWEDRIDIEKARSLITGQLTPEIRQCVISIRITAQGCGYIRTNSAAARSELSFQVGKIKDETNRLLGRKLIKKLKIY